MQPPADLIRTPSRKWLVSAEPGNPRRELVLPRRRQAYTADDHRLNGNPARHESLDCRWQRMLPEASGVQTGPPYARVTVRNPVLPVDESGVFEDRAALRYLLQYESWHRYEPPRITLPGPRAGPEGSRTVRSRMYSRTSPSTTPRRCRRSATARSRWARTCGPAPW